MLYAARLEWPLPQPPIERTTSRRHAQSSLSPREHHAGELPLQMTERVIEVACRGADGPASLGTRMQRSRIGQCIGDVALGRCNAFRTQAQPMWMT